MKFRNFRNFRPDVARRLYDAGAPDRAIARVMGYSQTLVRKWRLNASLPVHSDAMSWWGANNTLGKSAAAVRWEDFHSDLLSEIARS